MTFLLIAALAVLALIAVKTRLLSFRAQSPSDYAGTGPDFSLKDNLNGEILSEGLIYGPTGKMSNSFVARMIGEWTGNSGTLTEYFTYSNGKQMTRKWYLTMGTGNSFTATADDIVGDVVANGEILPDWGLHLLDVGIAQADLIALVESQAAAYGH